jgi:hypothetical protein
MASSLQVQRKCKIKQFFVLLKPKAHLVKARTSGPRKKDFIRILIYSFSEILYAFFGTMQNVVQFHF